MINCWVHRCGGELQNVLQYIYQIGTWASEVLAHHVLERLKRLGLDIELPVQVLACLPLHDGPSGSPPTAGTSPAQRSPRLVGIHVVADGLQCKHECRDEQLVARGVMSGVVVKSCGRAQWEWKWEPGGP